MQTARASGAMANMQPNIDNNATARARGVREYLRRCHSVGVRMESFIPLKFVIIEANRFQGPFMRSGFSIPIAEQPDSMAMGPAAHEHLVECR